MCLFKAHNKLLFGVALLENCFLLKITTDDILQAHIKPELNCFLKSNTTVS